MHLHASQMPARLSPPRGRPRMPRVRDNAVAQTASPPPASSMSKSPTCRPKPSPSPVRHAKPLGYAGRYIASTASSAENCPCGNGPLTTQVLSMISPADAEAAVSPQAPKPNPMDSTCHPSPATSHLPNGSYAATHHAPSMADNIQSMLQSPRGQAAAPPSTAAMLPKQSPGRNLKAYCDAAPGASAMLPLSPRMAPLDPKHVAAPPSSASNRPPAHPQQSDTVAAGGSLGPGLRSSLDQACSPQKDSSLRAGSPMSRLHKCSAGMDTAAADLEKPECSPGPAAGNHKTPGGGRSMATKLSVAVELSLPSTSPPTPGSGGQAPHLRHLHKQPNRIGSKGHLARAYVHAAGGHQAYGLHSPGGHHGLGYADTNGGRAFQEPASKLATRRSTLDAITKGSTVHDQPQQQHSQLQDGAEPPSAKPAPRTESSEHLQEPGRIGKDAAGEGKAALGGTAAESAAAAGGLVATSSFDIFSPAGSTPVSAALLAGSNQSAAAGASSTGSFPAALPASLLGPNAYAVAVVAGQVRRDSSAAKGPKEPDTSPAPWWACLFCGSSKTGSKSAPGTDPTDTAPAAGGAATPKELDTTLSTSSQACVHAEAQGSVAEDAACLHPGVDDAPQVVGAAAADWVPPAAAGATATQHAGGHGMHLDQDNSCISDHVHASSDLQAGSASMPGSSCAEVKPAECKSTAAAGSQNNTPGLLDVQHMDDGHASVAGAVTPEDALLCTTEQEILAALTDREEELTTQQAGTGTGVPVVVGGTGAALPSTGWQNGSSQRRAKAKLVSKSEDQGQWLRWLSAAKAASQRGQGLETVASMLEEAEGKLEQVAGSSSSTMRRVLPPRQHSCIVQGARGARPVLGRSHDRCSFPSLDDMWQSSLEGSAVDGPVPVLEPEPAVPPAIAEAALDLEDEPSMFHADTSPTPALPEVNEGEGIQRAPDKVPDGSRSGGARAKQGGGLWRPCGGGTSVPTSPADSLKPFSSTNPRRSPAGFEAGRVSRSKSTGRVGLPAASLWRPGGSPSPRGHFPDREVYIPAGFSPASPGSRSKSASRVLPSQVRSSGYGISRMAKTVGKVAMLAKSVVDVQQGRVSVAHADPKPWISPRDLPLRRQGALPSPRLSRACPAAELGLLRHAASGSHVVATRQAAAAQSYAQLSPYAAQAAVPASASATTGVLHVAELPFEVGLHEQVGEEAEPWHGAHEGRMPGQLQPTEPAVSQVSSGTPEDRAVPVLPAVPAERLVTDYEVAKSPFETSKPVAAFRLRPFSPSSEPPPCLSSFNPAPTISLVTSPRCSRCASAGCRAAEHHVPLKSKGSYAAKAAAAASRLQLTRSSNHLSSPCLTLSTLDLSDGCMEGNQQLSAFASLEQQQLMDVKGLGNTQMPSTEAAALILAASETSARDPAVLGPSQLDPLLLLPLDLAAAPPVRTKTVSVEDTELQALRPRSAAGRMLSFGSGMPRPGAAERQPDPGLMLQNALIIDWSSTSLQQYEQALEHFTDALQLGRPGRHSRVSTASDHSIGTRQASRFSNGSIAETYRSDKIQALGSAFNNMPEGGGGASGWSNLDQLYTMDSGDGSLGQPTRPVRITFDSYVAIQAAEEALHGRPASPFDVELHGRPASAEDARLHGRPLSVVQAGGTHLHGSPMPAELALHCMESRLTSASGLSEREGEDALNSVAATAQHDSTSAMPAMQGASEEAVPDMDEVCVLLPGEEDFCASESLICKGSRDVAAGGEAASETPAFGSHFSIASVAKAAGSAPGAVELRSAYDSALKAHAQQSTTALPAKALLGFAGMGVWEGMAETGCSEVAVEGLQGAGPLRSCFAVALPKLMGSSTAALCSNKGDLANDADAMIKPGKSGGEGGLRGASGSACVMVDVMQEAVFGSFLQLQASGKRQS